VYNSYYPNKEICFTFSCCISQQLSIETNRYYHQKLDSVDNGPSPHPDVTDSEKFLFLGIIQMSHYTTDWSPGEQVHTSSYSNIMKRDRFLHILRFLNFTDNNAEIDIQADNYDRLWKIRTIFNSLNDAYEKYYNPSEHLAVNEIIIKFNCSQSIIRIK
jgi:hypothetical protein